MYSMSVSFSSQKLWNLRPPRPLIEVLLDRSTSDDSYRTDVPSSARSIDDSARSVHVGSRLTPLADRLSPRFPLTPANLVDVDAELGAETINTETAAAFAPDSSASKTTN